MAVYAAVLSHIKLHVHGDSVQKRCSITKHSYIQMQRKCSSGSCKIMQLSSWKVCKLSASCFANVKANFCLKKNYTRCYCLGTLINSDGATTFDWVPVVNQGFLIASIFLTYMAGIMPAEKSLLKYRKNILNDHALPEDTNISGSATKNDEEDFNLKLAWNIVEGKLVDSLNAIEHEDNLGDTVIKFEQDNAKRPLSLYAVADGPRLRLLWASFQWLKEEVDNILGSSVSACMDDWLTVFSEIIQKTNQPVCMAWLEKELCLKKGQPDKALLSLMVAKLKGNNTILQNIRKAGKEDLYADFMCFLTFGFLREGCCYDYSLFTLHGVAILEDLVITLADGIASMYLELISVDGDMSNEMNSLGLILCTLSTRELQRLRNEVALNQWLHQNMEAVVSMYEDRFDLCTLQSQFIEESGQRQNENFSWWKKLTLRKSGSVLSPLRYVIIGYISVPVRRTKELRALTGWRYYFSLFLELADIAMPLIRTIFAKVSDAISFFLVCLIGRSLGLIYTGIRQSLRWK